MAEIKELYADGKVAKDFREVVEALRRLEEITWEVLNTDQSLKESYLVGTHKVGM